ncbi:MAG: laccase domain-containing protein [Methylocystis sp.]|nr:laccase domain-containing protein [Methylocystis sp.]
MTLETLALTARNLSLPGVRHAFFTRKGGVSEGVYATLNGGVGSHDAPPRVAENRARMAARLGVEAERLLVPFQIHSAEALAVREPWSADARPRCDGVVTAEASLALGGVIDATVSRMEAQGAHGADIHVALGPAIGATSYEVGPEFVARFREADESFARFFAPTDREGHATFDLPGFIASRVEALNVASFEDLGVDTYADEARCFSYRRSVHRREPDYGRLVSAITLI